MNIFVDNNIKTSYFFSSSKQSKVIVCVISIIALSILVYQAIKCAGNFLKNRKIQQQQEEQQLKPMLSRVAQDTLFNDSTVKSSSEEAVDPPLNPVVALQEEEVLLQMDEEVSAAPLEFSPAQAPIRAWQPETWDTLTVKSKEFLQACKRVAYPTQHNTIEAFATTAALQEEVVAHANGAQPFFPRRLYALLPEMIKYKREEGTPIEKEMYKDMTPEELLHRLITKRPLAFYEDKDKYCLRDGTKGRGGFEKIGTEEETEQLNLENYMSYWEQALSTFMCFTCPTHFINNGHKENRGRLGEGEEEGEAKRYLEKGIFVEMVGARLEKPGFMEWKHCIITKEQNTAENGYGAEADANNPKTKELALFAKLYNIERFADHREVLAAVQNGDQNRYVKLQKLRFGADVYFDSEVYKAFLRLKFESFLMDADERARKQGKEGFVHTVGLGLNCWIVDDCQIQLFLDAYGEVIKTLSLSHISDINFSYIGTRNMNHCGGVKDGFDIQDVNGHKIKVHFSTRNTADPLEGEDAKKLLIAAYPGDSNGYPGNEYWMGSLRASYDPAAACCSFIPQLQNPEVNNNLNGWNVAIRGN